MKLVEKTAQGDKREKKSYVFLWRFPLTVCMCLTARRISMNPGALSHIVSCNIVMQAFGKRKKDTNAELTATRVALTQQRPTQVEYHSFDLRLPLQGRW